MNKHLVVIAVALITGLILSGSAWAANASDCTSSQRWDSTAKKCVASDTASAYGQAGSNSAYGTGDPETKPAAAGSNTGTAAGY